MENYGKLRVRGVSAWDERMLLPISLDNAILYPFATVGISTPGTLIPNMGEARAEPQGVAQAVPLKN